jgi:hypothetical protein
VNSRLQGLQGSPKLLKKLISARNLIARQRDIETKKRQRQTDRQKDFSPKRLKKSTGARNLVARQRDIETKKTQRQRDRQKDISPKRLKK